MGGFENHLDVSVNEEDYARLNKNIVTQVFGEGNQALVGEEVRGPGIKALPCSQVRRVLRVGRLHHLVEVQDMLDPDYAATNPQSVIGYSVTLEPFTEEIARECRALDAATCFPQLQELGQRLGQQHGQRMGQQVGQQLRPVAPQT